MPTSLSFGLPLLALYLLLQLTGLPQRFDFWIYDSLTNTGLQTPSRDVAIVAIDEHSLRELGRWPWPRTTHAELVQKLEAAGAHTIVFDFLLTEQTPADGELALAMRHHGNVVLPMYLSPPANDQPATRQLPAPALRYAAAALGHAHIEMEGDGLARGLYLYKGLRGELWPSLAFAAARPDQASILPAVLAAGQLPGPYQSINAEYVRIPPTGSLPIYSYARVLASRYAADSFLGKTVFVGATAAGFGDTLSTPSSSLSVPMSGVEFHANSYSAIKQGQLIRLLPEAITFTIAVILLLALPLALPWLRPSRSFVTCLVTVSTLVSLDLILLLGYHLWLPLASALLVPLLACPLSSARRLAIANQFITRQLTILGHSQRVALPAPALRHPPLLLDQLCALIWPRGWFLSENNEILTAKGLQVDDEPPLPGPGVWLHLDNQSWIRLERGTSTYCLGLLLPDDLNREAIQRYLRRLTLNLIPGETSNLRPRENISARIERVRQATENLSSLHQFIRHSFERMPDGIIVTDELGVIRFANQHIEEWFGEPMPSLNGMPLTRLLDGHDPREVTPWHETVSETLTLNQSRTVDLRIRGMDFLIHFAPFSLPGSVQNGIIANISDISELREQQRQHREAIDFISHDVRSPLVSQLALIEQLKRHPAEIDSAQLDQLGRLARRSYQLAEEFVQLARAEQLTETRFYECELLSIAENARDSVAEQAAHKNIRLVLQGSDDLWLRGNAELLERAVINLLTNAVQYSPEDSVVTLQVFRAGHQACLTVSDEGAGIAEEEIPFLFDRFRRQKSTELSGVRGAGLGLSFVNVVVEKHRGQISVTSILGEGSAFTIRLPMADPMSTH